MSVNGTYRTWCDLCREFAKCSKADIDREPRGRRQTGRRSRLPGPIRGGYGGLLSASRTALSGGRRQFRERECLARRCPAPLPHRRARHSGVNGRHSARCRPRSPWPISPAWCGIVEAGRSKLADRPQIPFPGHFPGEGGRRRASRKTRKAAGLSGAPGRARTCNPQIRSLVLYPLSYGRLAESHAKQRMARISLACPRISSQSAAHPSRFGKAALRHSRA